MKYLILIVLGSFFSSFVHGQYLITGKVTDSEHQPIPYVNIGFAGTFIGTVSTAQGDFSLSLNEIPEKAIPLTFSCMGYASREVQLSAEPINQILQVQMEARSIELQELIVKSGAFKKREYGNNDETTAMKTNLAISDKPNMNLGAQIGRKFRLGDTENYVSKLKFYVAFNNFDSLLIRVNFYEIESGKPGRQLNSKQIVRHVINHKRGWVTFDLEDENIVLSGTIVAAIEWIGAGQRGSAFGLNINMPALFQTHYYRYGAQNTWKVFPNMSASMLLMVETAD